MSDLPEGLYEQLVTEGLSHQLRSIESASISREALDPADAHEVLARHVGDLARRALRLTGGDEQTDVVAQVQLANRIARAIVALAPEVTGEDDLISDSRDLLHALTHTPDLPGIVRFPPRPDVPLSASALLVN